MRYMETTCFNIDTTTIDSTKSVATKLIIIVLEIPTNKYYKKVTPIRSILNKEKTKDTYDRFERTRLRK